MGLLTRLYSVSRAPMLSQLSKSSRALMPDPNFSRDFLCICFDSPTELYIVFEARDCILRLFRHPAIYFHSKYLMESWHLKVGSYSLKISCMISQPCRFPFASAQMQEYVSLGHLQ